MAEAEVYLSVQGVADLFSVSPKTVYRWTKDGKLPYRRTLGGHHRYPLGEIKALLDDLTSDLGGGSW